MAKKYKPNTVRAAFSEWFVGDETADGEQRAFCPICEDPGQSSSPSASFNPEQGKWNCLKNRHGGSIADLAADLKKSRGWDIRSAAMSGRNRDKDFQAKRDAGLAAVGRRPAPLPDKKEVKRLHRQLVNSPGILQKLKDARGFDDDTIDEFEIGWNGYRYTFPIYDQDGKLVNVRQYKLGAGANKMVNVSGHGESRIYGIEDVSEKDVIVLTEGETDRLLLRQHLYDAGHDEIGVATHTSGARTFKPEWANLFKGKKVFVCYDVDDAGQKGMDRTMAILAPVADGCYRINLPLADRGADLTDYLLHAGTAQDFLKLMKTAEDDDVELPLPDKGKHMSLQESLAEEHQDEVLELTVSISGKQQAPATGPKVIRATCDMSKGAVCAVCPIGLANGNVEMSIRKDDERLFKFIDRSDDSYPKLLRQITGARCSDRVSFEMPQKYHIEELLVQPSIDDRRENESQQPIRRTVFSVGTHKSGVNEKVNLIGVNTTDPRSGRLRFMAWQNKRVETDIDRFEVDPETYSKLTIFMPSDDQTALDKCFEIAKNMADHVTHIYGRDLLHVAYDLVWHSVLGFYIKDIPEDKGWLEMMVVGDTRTGKSEIAKQLMRHYRSGEMLSCEGVTFAGIVGGVQQIDGRWHMTWGTVPMNDRRLVVLDEVSGMSESNVIERMSSIRSSGIAQITKIESAVTSARTRLIWISNPADGGMVGDHPNMGLSALQSVVPNNEDIARFDFVTAAVKGEVPDKLINSLGGEQSAPDYGSVECELLIKWAWSLTRDKIHITDAAINTMYKLARKLGREFVPEPPLVQSENVRFKLMRIACAIAARTFSATENGHLIVRAEHVKDAERFLQMVYGHQALGYKRVSQHKIHEEEVAQRNIGAVKAYLLEHEDLLEALQVIGASQFRHIDLENHGQMDRDQSQLHVKRLQQRFMLKRTNRGTLKLTSTMLRVLREIEEEQP